MSAAPMESTPSSSPALPPPRTRSGKSAVWVDPYILPNYGDASTIAGNAPHYVKQLNNNTFGAYGVGEADAFAHSVGKAVTFVEVNVDRKAERQGRLEATTVAEVAVGKNMLNGAGMMHGGCLAYLIDNCCSTPLVVLGIMQSVNGVGVTQSLNISFHAPAPLGAVLLVVSSSVTLGARVMTARCEVLDKFTGRVVASAVMNKMQPGTRL